jgi:histidyl-tRNA synthetase
MLLPLPSRSVRIRNIARQCMSNPHAAFSTKSGQSKKRNGSVSAIRGMQDLLPAQMAFHLHVANTAADVAAKYGYQEISTPILEDTNVFSRTLGDASDVVHKEMYSFDDRSSNSLTLRPEGTAGVMRAVLSNSLTMSLPLHYFYRGPMFRYERPQRGRYRQFHQIGAECIGPSGPMADVDMIVLGHQVLQALGIKNFELRVNTLGTPAARHAYSEVLRQYFSGHCNVNQLSEDSRSRLEQGVCVIF